MTIQVVDKSNLLLVVPILGLGRLCGTVRGCLLDKLWMMNELRRGEPLKGFDGSFFAHPEQTGNIEIDLIDQRQVFMAFGGASIRASDGPYSAGETQCLKSKPTT
jgi:hypothetical protein